MAAAAMSTPFTCDASSLNNLLSRQELVPKFSQLLRQNDSHKIRTNRSGSKWHQCMIKCSTSADSPNSADQSSVSKAGPAASPMKLVVNRRAAMVASMAAFGFGACSCCRAALAVDESEWSYGGPSGPPLWTGTCATGQKQSPIDVPLRKLQHGQPGLGELMFDYKLSSPVFTNPGHGTMEVQIPPPLSEK